VFGKNKTRDKRRDQKKKKKEKQKKKGTFPHATLFISFCLHFVFYKFVAQYVLNLTRQRSPRDLSRVGLDSVWLRRRREEPTRRLRLAGVREDTVAELL
jgi:hypothetical protein